MARVSDTERKPSSFAIRLLNAILRAERKHANDGPKAIDKSVSLEVSKALNQFELVAKSYNLTLWPENAPRPGIEPDLCIMRGYGDLVCITLQILDRSGTVVVEFPIKFTESHSPANGRRDTGLEIPVCRPDLLISTRLLVKRKGNDQAYRHLLGRSWSAAAALPKNATDKVRSGHLAKISGNRLQGQISVSNQVRRRIEVVRHREEWAYAFGRDLENGVGDIFMHIREVPKGYRFRVGDKVTATVVHTLRGLQARNIRVEREAS